MDFMDFVDSALQIALPLHWVKAAPELLLENTPIKINHAFVSHAAEAKFNQIHILVLPPTMILDQPTEKAIIALHDYILSEGWLLVVINQEEHENRWGETSVFIDEHLSIKRGGVLWISCIEDRNNLAMVEFELYEPVGNILRDLLHGRLRYGGPQPGFQQVNLELILDECSHCGQEIKTVTGVVYPDRQLRNWNSTIWRYYNQLVSLDKWKGSNATAIEKLVKSLQQKDRTITPVKALSRRKPPGSMLVASCPHCRQLRNGDDVVYYRDRYLFFLQSRLDGSLQYHPIGLAITDRDLVYLQEGTEFNDHARPTGWYR